MAQKADKITYNQRVETVYRLILDGWTAPQICPNVSAQWGVDERTARRYVRAARVRIEKDAEAYRKVALAEHIEARRQLRKNATDARLKLDIMRDEAKLLGLYPAERQEITSKHVIFEVVRQGTDG